MGLTPIIYSVSENKKLLLPGYARVYYVPSRPVLTRPTKRQRRLASHLTLNILGRFPDPHPALIKQSALDDLLRHRLQPERLRCD